ncbi:hypothetical protein C2G38_2232940 [Gigaspora rosea]|uniref:Uncharacterized protein n=1 Tax=Gigaspora rosea TaxID=44941 RepID=A0A397U059_9GLOM|nr:hypothetical protein C2G38_2232940 [Gigaspora rosea]
MKNTTAITIILLIAAIQQIVKAQNINVAVPVITVTQTPTNVLSPTTIITTQTVIQSLSTNYFNDANAKQQIQRLATTQTSRPPDYQGYP